MGEQIWQNCKLYIGGYNLSGDVNQMSLNYEADIKDVTSMGAEGREKLPGLTNVSADFSTLFEAGAGEVDDVIADKHSDPDEVMTIGPTTGADGQPAYSVKGILAQYAPQGSIGEALLLQVTAEGSGKLVRGTIMATGQKASTANGTARQLGAVIAGQKLYGILHVLAVEGTDPTLDVVIQSDIAEAFTDGTTRITFGQKTAIGAQFAAPVAGPIVDGAEADDWFRVSWTIGGSNSPKFTFLVVVGIQ